LIFINKRIPALLKNRQSIIAILQYFWKSLFHHLFMLNKYKYIIPLVCLTVFFIFQSIHRPVEDYAGYYFGSKFFLNSNFDAGTIYETYVFNQKIAAEGYTDLLVSYTPFPPITSLFFIPFAGFELYTSKLIFNCLSVLLFLFTLVRIIRFLKLPDWVLLLVPVVFFISIRNNIFFGQMYLILFSLMAEGFIFYKNKKYVYAALLWGPAIMLKIFPLICLLFIPLKKEWKQLLYLAASVLCLLLLSIGLNGMSIWKTYLFEIFPRVSNGELNDAYTPQFQSMFMLLKNIFVADEIRNPSPIVNSFLFFVITNLLFKAVILSVCILITLNKKTDDINKLGAWIIASILISPNGSTYSLILLLLPFVAFISHEKNIVSKWVLIIILLLINNLPVTLFRELPVVFQFPRLYLLIGFFVLFAFSYKITFNYWILFACVLVLVFQSVSDLFRSKDENSRYLFSDKKYLILYDYEILKNKLVVHYYNDINGEKRDTLYSNLSVRADVNLNVINNQVYWGANQLTYSNDRKIKPVLLNTNEILYLSDKNRGVGFYTLRVKKIGS
jgi:hypothetical protein